MEKNQTVKLVFKYMNNNPKLYIEPRKERVVISVKLIKTNEDESITLSNTVMVLVRNWYKKIFT